MTDVVRVEGLTSYMQREVVKNPGDCLGAVKRIEVEKADSVLP